jgi:hypothetical protein
MNSMNHVAFVMKSIASHPMPAAIDCLSRERSRLRQRVENHQIQNQMGAALFGQKIPAITLPF